MPKKKMNKPAAVIAEPSEESQQKHVLVAILGISPAVLTEAVWALAMQKNIVPDEIVILTTTEGKDKFFKDVYNSKIWNQLCSDLKAKGKPVDKMKIGQASFKIFPNENNDFAKDLPSYAANMRAADTMIEVLDGVIRGNKCVVHGLIAGGRKTMTALFFTCMCLMARKGDNVYHVLGPEKVPDFYYPRTPSEADKVNLFSVPFVRIGRWTEEMRKKCRSEGRGLTYQNLIQVVEHELDTALSKKREGAGGRSSLHVRRVTMYEGSEKTIFSIAADGKTIQARSKSFKITSKKMWAIVDKLLHAAERDVKNPWIPCTGDEINCFRGTTDALTFRKTWIDVEFASGKICKAKLRASPKDK